MNWACTYRYLVSLLILTMVVMAGWGVVTGALAQQAVIDRIRAQVEGDSTSGTAQFYRARSYRSAWVRELPESSQVEELLNALRRSEMDGLNPQNYGIQALETLYEAVKAGWGGPALQAELDVACTDAFFKLGTHLVRGRVDPTALYKGWIAAYREINLAQHLEAALASRTLKSAFEKLSPPHAGYRKLRTRLKYLLRLKVTGNMMGFLDQSEIKSRIDRIIINMERWRWLPDTLGKRYLQVNLADYTLDIVEHDRVVKSKRVVVGTPGNKTPVLSSNVTNVVLAPYWDVPYSIASEEILPKLRQDVGYLNRLKMKLFREGRAIDPETVDWAQVTHRTFTYFIRQEPGRHNALGIVKFIFPNPLGIRMHDTNERSLFNRTVRALSHGCVRVQDPLELAEYVLKNDPTWTGEKIKRYAARNQPTSISLKEPIPVHILYWTTWVDSNGLLQVRPDVYGHDQVLLKALSAPLEETY